MMQANSRRIIILERSHYKFLQYNRHECLEISGIPDTVPDKELESKTLEILDSIVVGKIEPWKVHTCHRLKNKKNVIIRLTSRKTADSALYKRGNIKKQNKTTIDLPANTKLYINEKLCPPSKYLHFKIRQLYKNKVIFSHDLWKGKLMNE